MRKSILIFAMISVVGAGCASTKKPTQREQASAQWNSARAGVLGNLAGDQFDTGNSSEASQTIANALALDPQNIRLRILSARIAIETGKLEGAQSELEVASKLDPNNPEVEYHKGIIAQHWMKNEEALAHYAQASRLKPNDLAYLLAQAEMLVILNRPDEALQMLIDRSSYFEHSAPIRDAIGQLYEQKGDTTEAAEYYRQASVLDPEDDTIRERLAVAWYRVGRHRDALTQLNRLLEKPEWSGRADLLVLAGECRFRQSLTVEARDAFETAARIDSSLIPAWQGIARTSLSVNDFRRASLALKKASALDPENASTWLLIGYTKMRQGDADGAFDAFSRAATLDSSDPVALTMMGLVLERSGQTDRAINQYGRALTVDPKDELAQKLMADVSR